MRTLNEMIEEMEFEEIEKKNRDYNFRLINKRKEQSRRKDIYDNRYFPTMPYKGYGDNGEEYYVEGSKDELKKVLKKTANKRARGYEDLSDGGFYRKVYGLAYIWY